MSNIHEKVLEILKTHQEESEKQLKSKLLELLSQPRQLPPFPSIDFFSNLTEEELASLIKKDKSYRTYHDQLVHRACRKGMPTEYIVYLIEKGFPYSEWDTPSLIQHGNMDLIKYYHTKTSVKSNWNFFSLSEAVKVNRADILEYLLDNNLVKTLSKDNDYLHYAIDTCFGMSSKEMFSVLLSKRPDAVKTYIHRSIFPNIDMMKYLKPTNQFLIFLWDNGLKWTSEEAKFLGNPFMRSFFQ